MTPGLFSVEEVSAMIREEKKLLLAGDTKLLSQLPKGDWIGGTTPYFILRPEQMVESCEKLFVACLPDFVEAIEVREYDSSDIENIYSDAPQNGLTAIIIPFGSSVLSEFALNVTDYKNFARYPLCGWVSGQRLDVITTEKSYVRSGISDSLHSDKAVAMHIVLPENKYAEIHMSNSFEQSCGDIITFEHKTLVVKEALVNGVKQNFATYLREAKVDTKMPLVANYSGAMLNTNCFVIETDTVYLSSPVFEQIEYRFARQSAFALEQDIADKNVVMSASCVLNYVWPELCGKYIEIINAPAVYGQIVYQLISQITMSVTIGDVSSNSEII